MLAESGAVVEYIIAKYGNGRLALSSSHPDFAAFLYWFHFANGTFQKHLAVTGKEVLFGYLLGVTLGIAFGAEIVGRYLVQLGNALAVGPFIDVRAVLYDLPGDPRPFYEVVDGKVHEPMEHLTVDIPEDYLGGLRACAIEALNSASRPGSEARPRSLAARANAFSSPPSFAIALLIERFWSGWIPELTISTARRTYARSRRSDGRSRGSG